jgi:hypothetical protein
LVFLECCYYIIAAPDLDGLVIPSWHFKWAEIDGWVHRAVVSLVCFIISVVLEVEAGAHHGYYCTHWHHAPQRASYGEFIPLCSLILIRRSLPALKYLTRILCYLSDPVLRPDLDLLTCRNFMVIVVWSSCYILLIHIEIRRCTYTSGFPWHY